MYESGENYLETILILKQKKGTVRSIDVARELGFSKPSVSRAMGLLKDAGFLKKDAGGELVLTEAGEKEAAAILGRHKFLTDFLVQIAKVDEKTAEEDACRMEHVISEETYEGLKNYMKGFK